MFRLFDTLENIINKKVFKYNFHLHDITKASFYIPLKYKKKKIFKKKNL